MRVEFVRHMIYIKMAFAGKKLVVAIVVSSSQKKLMLIPRNGKKKVLRGFKNSKGYALTT